MLNGEHKDNDYAAYISKNVIPSVDFGTELGPTADNKISTDQHYLSNVKKFSRPRISFLENLKRAI